MTDITFEPILSYARDYDPAWFVAGPISREFNDPKAFESYLKALRAYSTGTIDIKKDRRTSEQRIRAIRKIPPPGVEQKGEGFNLVVIYSAKATNPPIQVSISADATVVFTPANGTPIPRGHWGAERPGIIPCNKLLPQAAVDPAPPGLNMDAHCHRSGQLYGRPMGTFTVPQSEHGTYLVTVRASMSVQDQDGPGEGMQAPRSFERPFGFAADNVMIFSAPQQFIRDR